MKTGKEERKRRKDLIQKDVCTYTGKLTKAKKETNIQTNKQTNKHRHPRTHMQACKQSLVFNPSKIKPTTKKKEKKRKKHEKATKLKARSKEEMHPKA